MVVNPIVGEFHISKKNQTKFELFIQKIILNTNVIPFLYLNDSYMETTSIISKFGKSLYDCIWYVDDENSSKYKAITSNVRPILIFTKDSALLRRTIIGNKILISDGFKKKPRNSDYSEIVDEFFSSDHLFYKDEGYEGFSDYSIIGSEYNEGGFAPFSVAIHITYFDNEENLRVHHFVSDSNDGIEDTPRKFSEALQKLVSWNVKMNLNTFGINEFLKLFKEKNYPGLGVVKKLSIMHHLELMSSYLSK